MRTMRARLTALGSAAALAVALIAAAPPSGAQETASDADFGGYATGTVAHADALQPADESLRFLDAEVAFSSAAMESQGLSTALHNEFQRLVHPELPDATAYGRGSGVEVGVGLDSPDAENQVIPGGIAEASSPPDDGPVTSELASLPPEMDPLVWAGLLRGEADANTGATPCTALGQDFASGSGQVADAELLDQDQTANDPEGLEQPLVSLNAPDNERAVSSSTSHTRFVPHDDGNALGVLSETRVTIAPITLFAGTENATTIEVLGEWVLRAVATGESGSVHYGPADAEPETPILRVVDQTTGEVTNIVTFQDLLGEEGLVINDDPMFSLVVGEDARAIGQGADSQPTESATEAAGAVDVLRIRLAGEPGKAAEVRVGHMESRAVVPSGGVTCELPVNKASSVDTATEGDTFTHTITVENPFACTLENVEIVDEMSAEPADQIDFSIGDVGDGSVSGDTITWDDVGPIAPGESAEVTVEVTLDTVDATGVVVDDVTATGTCAVGAADGETTVDVAVAGSAHLEAPDVTPTEVAGETEQARGAQALPATGGSLLAGFAAMALISGAAAMRRFFRVR